MPAAHVDLAEHILVSDLLACVIEVDHSPADIEERYHLAAIVGDNEGVDLARWLVDETSLVGNPVMLQITPLALDHVSDDDHRMAVTGKHTRTAHAQQIAPSTADRVQQQRTKPDVGSLRYPDALVARYRLDRNLRNNPVTRQDRRSGHGGSFSADVSSATSRSTSRSLGNVLPARRYQ